MIDNEEEVHKFWSDDRKRHAHVIHNKEFNMYLVRMFEDNKLIKSVPMISDATTVIVKDLLKMPKTGV